MPTKSFSFESIKAASLSLGEPCFSNVSYLNLVSKLTAFIFPFSFTTQGEAVDSLRSDLASANAKLDELRTEISVLRAQASRSQELAKEKATLLSQQDALSKVSRFPADASRARSLTSLPCPGPPTSSQRNHCLRDESPH